MSNRIRGITIEIDGNTTGLNKALNEVNNTTRKTQSELKKVEKALKFNPGNTELLAQKQQLLAKEVSNTSTKLNALRQAQAQVEQQFRNGEIGEEQYRAFQRELIETESRLRHFEDELARSQSRMRQMGQSMQEVGANIKKVGDGMQNVGKQLTTAVTLPIVGLGAAAAKVGMDFEAGMSKVGAISGSTAADMERLSAKAKEMGSQTKFSATEASDAFSFMALAGWDADQMIAGIGGTLALAAASGEDLAQTTDIVTDGMSMFAMKANEAGRFADVLAAASANTNTDVKGLGEALKYAGASANAAGLDIEQTSAFIGMLANNGIKGSSAGTTMNAVLRDLGKSAKDGKIQLGDMSVAVYDAEGNMRSLSDIMADVETATKGMNDEARNDALRANFGDEALRGVNIALASGADELKRLEKEMYNAAGTAEKMAAVMSDNLKGRLTELGSALEGIGIKIYENMQPALEKAVELAQKLADKFMALSPEMQNTIVVIAAVVAAIGPVILVLGMFVSAIGTIVSAIGSMMVAFSAGGAAAGVLGAAFTLLTGPIGITIGAIGLLVGALILAWNQSETFRDIVKNSFEAVKEAVTNVMNAVSDFIQEVWGKITDFWNENGEQIKQVTENVWNVIKGIFETILPFIQAIFKVQFELIKIIVETVWETIKNIIDGVLNVILGLVKTFSSLFTGDWKGVWEGIKQVTSGIGALIFEWIQTMFFGKLIKAVGKFVKPFADYIKNMWNAIKGATESITNGIKVYINTVWNAIKAIVEGVMKGIKGVIDTVWNAIKGVITTVTSSIKGTIDTAWNTIKSTTKTVWDNVKSAMVKPIESARDTIKGIVDKIKGFFENMKLKIPKIEMPKLPKFSLTGEFSLKPPSVPKIGISWHAKGGIFDTPTLFPTDDGFNGVGEDGPEAILPLTQSVLSGIGEGIAKTMQTQSSTTVIQPQPIYLDGEQIATVTYDVIDSKLGNKQTIKGLMRGL